MHNSVCIVGVIAIYYFLQTLCLPSPARLLITQQLFVMSALSVAVRTNGEVLLRVICKMNVAKNLDAYVLIVHTDVKCGPTC